MKIFKNKTIIGLLSILFGVVVCFILSPIYNASIEEKVKIVRVVKAIPQNVKIEKSMLEEVSVGKYNLPDTVITKFEDVVGNYSRTDLYKGDYIVSTKIEEKATDNYFDTLGKDNNAMSVTVKSLALGVSNKLQYGDIVSVYVTTEDVTVCPPELKYVQVLATTDTEAIDVKGNYGEEEQRIASTVTLRVNDIQAITLAKSEQAGTIHIALVLRDTEEKTKELLDEQVTAIENIETEIEDVEVVDDTGENIDNTETTDNIEGGKVNE